jgi:hypothetical protein
MRPKDKEPYLPLRDDRKVDENENEGGDEGGPKKNNSLA